MNPDTVRVAETYDHAMYDANYRALWENSDFCNFGYWRPDTVDHRQACEGLVDALLAFMPGEPARILDVACGLGATTGHIASRYPDAQVVGVNISAKQLQTARRKRPTCGFARMDAVTLAFPDESFDAVVCVEAAFHFDTRERFLREAHRVLKPGGHLVLSDILIKPWMSRLRSSVTVRNMAISLDRYRQSYGESGFRPPQILDSTTESVTRLCGYHRRWSASRLRDNWDVRPHLRLMLFDGLLLAGIDRYLLVGAQKA